MNKIIYTNLNSAKHCIMQMCQIIKAEKFF